MSDLVSVIIPVYKTEAYLRRCVESVQRQDHSPLEIILVDDGSPDGAGALCDQLAAEDERIQAVHRENGGLSCARNTGLEHARGDYVCFVDSDDYVAADYVSTLYGMIESTGADLAKIDYREVTADRWEEKPKRCSVSVFEGREAERAFLSLRVDSACVFLYRRSLIGDTRFPEGKTSEDIPFNFAVFQKAKKVAYAPAVKYFYYHNPESISNGPLDRNMLNYLHFRKEIYDFYREKQQQDLCRMAEAQYARAAMGLMTRMAFYGIREGMDEGEYARLFRGEFRAHAKAYYREPTVSLSRKALAVLVFRAYPVAKLLGRVAK